MKKILGLLAVTVLGSTTTVPNIALNTMIIDQYQNINLPITRIQQETNNYCVPAVIQMIFSFYEIDLARFSQDQIYEDLEGDEGVVIDSEVSDYVNEHASTSYAVNKIRRNFGANLQEQWTFQNYVYRSLSHNYPLLLAYRRSGLNYGHAVLITGIAPNWANPALTVYTYLNPARSSSGTVQITGADLASLFANGGEIMGEGRNSEFQNRGIPIAINNCEVGANWLNDYEDHEVARLRTDLTATTGATTTGNFANMVDNIGLPKFYGQINLFTWKKTVDSFNMPTDIIPENNDNWSSKKITIANQYENVGSAHIEGRIMGQIQFERTKSLNHLLMYLIIYIGGVSWATSNWPYVWFQTGSILDFTKK